MSEQKHFDYTAENPVFIQNIPKKIEILGIRNLIPIEIICELDDVESKIKAYVDYNSKKLSIPDVSKATEEKISDEFFNFIDNRTALPSDMYAEESPSVPKVPKEEDTIF